MERRSWPWKKKSSNKSISEKKVDASDSVGASLASIGSLPHSEFSTKINFVQISLSKYTYLSNLEDQVQMLQNQVTDLNEKLSLAHKEMSAKDNLVNQHVKVAEEAVSGWEKANAEAVELKNQLESITFLKLTAEDKVSRLDCALKECTRHLRAVREESEQKLNEVILTKTKQFDKHKLDLESQIADLEIKLLRSAAEKDALTNMVMEINSQKSEAEGENEHLKTDIQSYEKEINSLKYEFHVVSKELDIRKEEKNMSKRLAEAANKQHLADVMKIEDLELECQRLHNLLRKKLPGPAAMAQMKHVVKSSNKSQDTEFLTTRLLVMEEETNMLKEALSARNKELQCSREMCSKMGARLKILEAQTGMIEGSLSQCVGDPRSVTSMSEAGFDDDVSSSSESWAIMSVSDKWNKGINGCSMELMDDFLEMEKLACSRNETSSSDSKV